MLPFLCSYVEQACHQRFGVSMSQKSKESLRGYVFMVLVSACMWSTLRVIRQHKAVKASYLSHFGKHA